MRITISSEEFTTEAMAKNWADDETLTQAGADLMAQVEYGKLVRLCHTALPGWTFVNGTFSGPARSSIVEEITAFQMLVVDEVVAEMDEIITEAAAEDALSQDRHPTLEDIAKYRVAKAEVNAA